MTNFLGPPLKAYLNRFNSTYKLLGLQKKAKTLFTDLKKTGEGGEILLYVLTQEFLKFPQLLSKMSLKTSGKLHYQGVDGIHANYDPRQKKLNLFWGESKMYSSFSTAVSKCLESLESFLLDPQSYKSIQERDLQLISASISSNVNNPELEDLLVRYFDKDDDLSNNLEYKGICFVGFDTDAYPKNKDLYATTEKIKDSIQMQTDAWHKTLSEKLQEFEKLTLKEIHFFLIPFPSVSDFRNYFLEEIL